MVEADSPDAWCSQHKLVLASGNTGKLRELGEMLQPLGWEVLPQSRWQVPEAVEDGLTFLENALIKARHASRITGLPALADDSGLVVDALAGAPGIYSSRFAGQGASDKANNEKLLNSLVAIPENKRAAHFYCAMVMLRHEHDPAPLLAFGAWHGSICQAETGDGGFGYDPLFLVSGQGCTSAQLDPQTKNRLSHRGKALSMLLEQLNPAQFN